MSYIVILMSFTAIFPSIGYGQTDITNYTVEPNWDFQDFQKKEKKS
jgi:hypothetical protein